MPSPPPTPSHTLRTHSSPLTTLFFSSDNERIYAGDSSGVVSITSTRSLRPIAKWRAHDDGVLGVEEWVVGRARTVKMKGNENEKEGRKVLTHGRDNKLHVWFLPQDRTRKLREAAIQPDLPTPELAYSIDVNALNYCRFSLMPIPDNLLQENVEEGRGVQEEGLIAVPNLVESSLADIWSLPSLTRLHAAIGKQTHHPRANVADGRGLNAAGIIMSLHLFETPAVGHQTQLKLVCGYENGSVTLWGFDGVGTGTLKRDKGKGKETEKETEAEMGRRRRTSVEGVGWVSLLTVKLHVESVMAMTVTRDNSLALTVSADHLVGRYNLAIAGKSSDEVKAGCTTHRTKHPGNGAIAIRDDGKVCAVGGWDGKVRLYSTRTLKHLGTLDYHKKNTQAVVFAHTPDQYQHQQSPGASASAQAGGSIDEEGDGGSGEDEEEDDDKDDDADEMTSDEKEAKQRWLAAGSQDCRVSIWKLISFEKT